MAYGVWMRAAIQAERVKQNRNKEKLSREQFQPKAHVTGANSPEPHQNQHGLEGQNGPVVNKEGIAVGNSEEPRGTSQKPGIDKEQLMLNLAEPENQQKECQSKDIGFNEEQRMTARNDGQLRSKCIKAGNENGREDKIPSWNEKGRETTVAKRADE